MKKFYRMLVRFVFIFICGVSLNCCKNISSGNKIDKDIVKDMSIGSSKDKDILLKLGKPNIRLNENGLDCWYYVHGMSKVLLSINLETKYSFIRLCFSNGILKEMSSRFQ